MNITLLMIVTGIGWVTLIAVNEWMSRQALKTKLRDFHQYPTPVWLREFTSTFGVLLIFCSLAHTLAGFATFGWETKPRATVSVMFATWLIVLSGIWLSNITSAFKGFLGYVWEQFLDSEPIRWLKS